MQKNSTSEQNKKRPRIAIITNHGYAGADIPVGGAPDTGGQNFYVNAKAVALEEIGMDVTIFTRGGFPFFDQNRIRRGEETLSKNVRYVYMPGGGDQFIRKEDIATSLKEEAEWMTDFVALEAAEEGIDPWDYYEVLDTHYWDAAIIANLVVERWHNEITYNFLSQCADGKLKEGLKEYSGDNMHKRSLAREAEMRVGEIAREVCKGRDIKETFAAFEPDSTLNVNIRYSDATPIAYRGLELTYQLGKELLNYLKVGKKTLDQHLAATQRHVWTPHSTGIIKERNYWDKDIQTVRSLKFTERNDHEESVCMHTPLFCSTSPEVWSTLYSYHKQKSACIFDFPPCLDTEMFRPRSEKELRSVYNYLSEISGIPAEKLKTSKIIFESSRMDRTKRKDILLRAFAPIAKNHNDIYLFIGGGPENNPVFKELTQLKDSLPELNGRAFLMGYIPGDYIEQCFSVPTLFVSASEMEGFGMSVSQAAAAKVAIVSSDLIPFSTQFAAEATEIVPAGDVDAFTEKMEMLLFDEVKREGNAEKLFAIAQKLNWNNKSEAFVKWYRAYFDIQS